MSHHVLGPEAKPCVWMCAGVLTYRLCDRNYQCECCPLDAALSVPLRPGRSLVNGGRPEALPADRRYAPGHTWVRPLPGDDPAVWRLGLDRFAAAVLGCANGVHCRVPDRRLERGDLICDLDLGVGTLSLGSPVGGMFVRGNPLLRESPERLLTGPYEEGWIAEMAEVEVEELSALSGPEDARDRTLHDLTRFRRAVAVRLFSDLPDRWNTDCRTLTDLRHWLGRSDYLELVAEFVH